MDTMTRLRRTPTRALRRAGRGRAATMIEFAMILPVFLFMMLFTFDMGTMMLLSGAMNDAAYSSARAGAQVGGAGVKPNGGGMSCWGGTCTSGVSYESMSQSVAQIPMGAPIFEWKPEQVQVLTGAECRSQGDESYVTVRTYYQVDFLTPGLTTLMHLTSSGARDSIDGFDLSATGVARCEIYRTF